MKAKLLVYVLPALILATVHLAEAQQPKKVPRIGVLFASTPSANSRRLEAFRQGLRDLGYIEGQNITIEYRYAEGKLDRLRELAVELVRLKVDVIVTGGDIPVQAAKNATKTIPIVMWAQEAILSMKAWLKALPVPAATLPALQTLPQN